MNAHAHSPVSIAVAQLNLTVGDLAGNADRIIAALEEARAAGADLLLTPELALSGYPPEDLLLRPDFYRACSHETERIAAAATGITVAAVDLASIAAIAAGVSTGGHGREAALRRHSASGRPS